MVAANQNQKAKYIGDEHLVILPSKNYIANLKKTQISCIQINNFPTSKGILTVHGKKQIKNVFKIRNKDVGN